MGVMIVTGGGRGIGAAIATLAGERGYKVAVNYRANRARAEEVVGAIRKKGGTAIPIEADVAKEPELLAMFERVDREFGPVTALVNNAGLDIERFLAELRLADVETIFRTNVFGLMVASREAIARMSTKQGGKGGVIVNIGSVAGRTGGMPRDGVYAASKGAVDTFTRALAIEVAQQGIRAVCVRPGLTDTEIFGGPEDRKMAAEIAKTGVPMGRIGEVEEVARFVLWLCSDEASYVTGFSYDVSGGR
jgi:NAD(P)-dependent dehydrogenase (short-subunit alcohol dehydrogenase family)